jgi:hypothetical protein
MHGGQGIGVLGNTILSANYASGTLTVLNDADGSAGFSVPVDVEYIRGWQESGGNHGPLGEPVAPSFAYWYSEQQFERGSMHWRQRAAGPNQIYVFDNESPQSGGTDWTGRDSGIWMQYDDGWQSGMPLLACDDAWWPYGPMMGFGKVWCEQPEVKERIGYPIDEEYGTVGGDQAFTNGSVFWNPASDAYYVLYSDTHRWQWYRAHRHHEAQAIAPNVSGRIALQGRADHRGIVLNSPAGPHTTTDENGHFGLHYEGQMQLIIHHPGYLDVIATVKVGAGTHLDMNEFVMPGGDVNGDNRIDILDLSYVGYKFGTADTAADLNGDGSVDIFDLSLAGANFGRVGPLYWDQ